MTAPSRRLPFDNASPGQSLYELVQRFSQDNLNVVLGNDLTDLVHALSTVDNLPSSLRNAASFTLRENLDDLLRRSNIRRICLDALSAEKQRQLLKRVSATDTASLYSEDFASTCDPRTWSDFLGFFGHVSDPPSVSSFVASQEEILPRYTLFPHQRHTARVVIDALQLSGARTVLHMPTGSGKTRTAMHVLCHAITAHEPCSVAWLANSAELLDQAAGAFELAWRHRGDRPLKLVRFWGRHNPDLSSFSDGLLVASFQKMHTWSTRNPVAALRLARPIRLVVVDEAHQAIAPTYRRTIDLLTETGVHSSLLGLTATPGRSYSDVRADARLVEFFGDGKKTLVTRSDRDPMTFLMDEGYLARPRFRQLTFAADPSFRRAYKRTRSGPDYSTKVLDALAQQTTRSAEIISEVQQLVERGHKRVLVFATSVRHADVIAAALHVLGLRAYSITSNTRLSQRERIISLYRRTDSHAMVLCNYGVLTTGFDAPKTSAAIIARPTRSLVLYSQMLGRATRGPLAGGNATCEVVTVVDLDLPGFRDVVEAFTNWEDVWSE